MLKNLIHWINTNIVTIILHESRKTRQVVDQWLLNRKSSAALTNYLLIFENVYRLFAVYVTMHEQLY